MALHLLDPERAIAHKRALRAATAVTGMLVGLIGGCASTVIPSEHTQTVDVASRDARADVAPDARTEPDAAPDTTVDVASDTGTDVVGDVQCDRTSPNYGACCEAANWDPNRGCEAWGPLMPPTMEV